MTGTAALGRTELGVGIGTETSAGIDYWAVGTETGENTGTGKDTGIWEDTGTGKDTGIWEDTGTGKDTGIWEDTGTGKNTEIWEDTGETLEVAGTMLVIPEQERQRCPECWSWPEGCKALGPAPRSKAEARAAGTSQFQPSLW